MSHSLDPMFADILAHFPGAGRIPRGISTTPPMTTDSVDFATELHAAYLGQRHLFVAARAPMEACWSDASATPHAKYAAFWTFRSQTREARAYLRREAHRIRTRKDSVGGA